MTVCTIRASLGRFCYHSTKLPQVGPNQFYKINTGLSYIKLYDDKIIFHNILTRWVFKKFISVIVRMVFVRNRNLYKSSPS